MSPQNITNFKGLSEKDLPSAQEVKNQEIVPEIKEMAPEAAPETESKEIQPEVAKVKESLEQTGLGSKAPISAALGSAKSETLVKIENILEEDLADVYFKLEPKVKEKFKKQGEETSAKIEKLLLETKVQTKKIFKLILEWLKIIPGVNKFFIRQEAKIKTDRIIKIK